MKLKKNDTVMIIAGKDKGKSGKIVKVDREKERVVVQGANMVKKSMRKKTNRTRAASWKLRHQSMFQM